MSAPITIAQGRDSITLISATPGRMRRGLVRFLLLALLMLPFVSCMVYPLFVVGAESLVVTPLRLLVGSWVFWALCGVVVLLFALDGRSRLKIVWGAERLRSSWLFGPLELFDVERERATLGPLVIVERQPASGLMLALSGREGGWVVGWQLHRGKDRPPELMELARIASQHEAQQLATRLQAWPQLPDRAAGVPAPAATPAFEPVTALASSGLTWLMRLPLAMFVGLCLALIGLALESLAIERGEAPKILPWNASASAEITRLHWRLALRPNETMAAGQQVRFNSVSSQLQAAVRFVDAKGETRERPLALAGPDGIRPVSSNGGPAYTIEQFAQAGIRMSPIAFEVPRDVLDIPVEADGTMRFDQVKTQSDGDPLTTAWHMHWAGLTKIDQPSLFLPLLWSEPTLGPKLEIVYRASDPADAPVWTAAQAASFESRLATLDGMAYPLGVFGLVAGAIAFYWLAPRRLRLLSVPLWFLLAVSATGWTPLATELSTWVGVDRGLQSRVRDAIARTVMPAAEVLQPLAADVAVGRWTPAGSRYRELLAHLGLAQMPAVALPDLASARTAIIHSAHTHMASMNADQRAALLDTLSVTPSLRRDGNTWLADSVIVPGLCAWRGDEVMSAQARQHYGPILDALECGAEGEQ